MVLISTGGASTLLHQLLNQSPAAAEVSGSSIFAFCYSGEAMKPGAERRGETRSSIWCFQAKPRDCAIPLQRSPSSTQPLFIYTIYLHYGLDNDIRGAAQHSCILNGLCKMGGLPVKRRKSRRYMMFFELQKPFREVSGPHWFILTTISPKRPNKEIIFE